LLLPLLFLVLVAAVVLLLLLLEVEQELPNPPHQEHYDVMHLWRHASVILRCQPAL